VVSLGNDWEKVKEKLTYSRLIKPVWVIFGLDFFSSPVMKK
jgi:hypothetical protein